MVHYYRSQQGVLIYKGKDKFQNQDLIKYHFPQDIWFHVDDLSSAHVYLRMQQNMTFQNLPKHLIDQCCQLVKQNSIQGCKKHEVDIIYTLASNVLKRPQHQIGQVSFKDQKKICKVKHVMRDKDLLKCINKTFKQQYPNLQQLLLKRQQQIQRIKAKQLKQLKIAQKQKQKQRIKLKEAMSYNNMWDDQLVQSNKKADQQQDDDFM